MITADKVLVKKLGVAAAGGISVGLMTSGVIFAAGFVYELRKQKKQPKRQRVPIAEYNQVVRNYNAVVTQVNAQLEEVFPDHPKLQMVLEQMESEAFDAEFNGLMNEHW